MQELRSANEQEKQKTVLQFPVPQGKSGPNQTMRERLKLAVLEDAHIVCSTLAFSGSPLLSRLSRPFDVVVIDEAAQAVEPSTLIPLCTGAQQVPLLSPFQLATQLSWSQGLHELRVYRADRGWGAEFRVCGFVVYFPRTSSVARVPTNQLPPLQVPSHQDHS